MKKPLWITGAAITGFLLIAAITDVWALSDGYILCGAYGGKTTALIDKEGTIAKLWDHSTLTSNLNGYSCYLLENGNLLRTAQVGAMAKKPLNANPTQGVIDEVDSNGNVVWTYTLSNDTAMLHHDMKVLPNGNILAISFSVHTKTEMKRVGIDTSLLKSGMGTLQFLLADKIVEINRNKQIVWEWRVIDHVVPQDQAAAHPEKISGSIVSALWQSQWMHLNGLDYRADKDLIVFSSRIFSELYVIDHSTTKEQAAGSTGGNYGKGGDILYRWGKPGNYGASASGATTIDCLHSTTWIPQGYEGAGNIMFFHNNIAAIKSQVIEIKPPVDAEGKFIYESGKPFGPDAPLWKYAPTSDFYSRFMSSAIRMANGNTVTHETFPTKTQPAEGTIPNTDSRVREVTPAGTVAWEYTLQLKAETGFNSAKIMYYPSTYIGVRKLLNLPVGIGNNTVSIESIFSYPRISQRAGRIDFSNVAGCEIDLFNLQGKKVFSARPASSRFAIERLVRGPYIVAVQSKSAVQRTLRVIP